MTAVQTSATESEGQDHRELFGQLAAAIQENLDPSQIVSAEDVWRIAQDAVMEGLRNFQPPATRIEFTADGQQVGTVESPHCQFGELTELVDEGAENVLLVGPAGTGKTTMAKHLAEALGREFGFLSLSAGVTETHLFGRVLPQADGTWAWQPTRFVEIYENGGVFLLDELDAADANVMVAINAALANGQLANPITGRIHKRHPHCIIVAAANTWGLGGDAMYVGRNPLDAATLDRFCLAKLLIGYDEDLERGIASNLPPAEREALLAWVQGVRDAIGRNRLRRVASTRLVERATRALLKGRGLDAVQARYFQDWTADEKAKVQA